MRTVEEQLKKLISKKNHLKNLIWYLNKEYEVGDKIMGERLLAEELGENRTSVREALICLECFEFVEREHGKSPVLMKDFKGITEFLN